MNVLCATLASFVASWTQGLLFCLHHPPCFPHAVPTLSLLILMLTLSLTWPWSPHRAGLRPLGGPTVLTARPLCTPLSLILTFPLVLESAVSLENPTPLSGGWWDGVRAQRWARGVLMAFGLLWAPDRAREYVFVCVWGGVWVCVESYTPMSAHICALFISIFISKLGSEFTPPIPVQ